MTNKSDGDPSLVIDPVWTALREEVVGLHGVRKVMLDLFGRDEDTVALLNRSAGTLFSIVETLLIRDLIMGIGRLTDPAVQGKGKGAKMNLSVERLLDLPWISNSPERQRLVQEKLQMVSTSTEPFRDHRNKKIGHLDLATRIGDEVLPGLTVSHVDIALRAIADAMNAANPDQNSTTFYADVIHSGGADSLVNRLRQAEKWRRQEQERITATLHGQDRSRGEVH